MPRTLISRCTANNGGQARLTSYDHVMRSVPDFDSLSGTMIGMLSSGVPKNARVLEVGSGTGLFTRRLLQCDFVRELVCVDPDAEACESLATILRGNKEHGARCQVKAMRAENLQDQGGFDIVAARFVLHHIPDEEKADFLRVVRRALKIQGILVLGDMTLPHYKSARERRIAVEEYYNSTMRVANSIGDGLLLHDQVACRMDDLQQDGEYKVCRCRVLAAMRHAKFTGIRSLPCTDLCKSCQRWPGLMAYSGSRMT